MQATPVKLVRRPVGHVPAGGQRQQGADGGLVRDGDDLLLRRQPSAGGGRRQRRASASPSRLKSMSANPCRRRSAFQVVEAWRRTAKGTVIAEAIAAFAAPPPAHGPRRARRDAQRSAPR